ncbi:MAG TPA: GTPase domain-containing protein, partial [Accumulibacter sp.]|uniref:GTPase domain-containing protein n=1 Tax=Accumulibacter sp. TaxID=2053492 RepID=UPI002CF57E72
MSTDARAIALSLISHTNAGKTTLARTLLGRDVGEVRDAAHVTTESTPYPLIDTAEGDTLLLWDTPGFGDSARLARRLAQQGNPIGWFLSQIWDRFRDQPFHLSQQAVRNVRDEADVVLYLVNAAEAPADAGYLAPELDVLAWIGRPVVVLLNQTGPPRPHTAEQADVQRWREALGERAFVRDVLTLDAFARCWVQEIVLLRTLA